VDRDGIHGNVRKCCFCDNGNYDGLNHVVPIETPAKIGERTPVYSIPGCKSCNGRYSAILELQRDVDKIFCGFAEAKRFFVMR
jgi:hypothetical protein